MYILCILHLLLSIYISHPRIYTYIFSALIIIIIYTIDLTQARTRYQVKPPSSLSPRSPDCPSPTPAPEKTYTAYDPAMSPMYARTKGTFNKDNYDHFDNSNNNTSIYSAAEQAEWTIQSYKTMFEESKIGGGHNSDLYTTTTTTTPKPTNVPENNSNIHNIYDIHCSNGSSSYNNTNYNNDNSTNNNNNNNTIQEVMHVQ